MPMYHPSDMPEWVHHMHALQNIVMARQAVREEPEFFRKDNKDRQCEVPV